MASCTQVEQLQQAYIDDELSDAQRVILDEHVARCEGCRAVKLSLQRTNAELFERFADFRLNRDLSRAVLEHLPEMEPRPKRDMTETNRRMKHPDTAGERLRRFMPLAAAVLLVILGAVIRDYWPAPLASSDTVGVVTGSEGDSVVAYSLNAEPRRAKAASYVTRGTRYQTGDKGRLMLTLAGPTTVKLNRGTTVVVHDDRMVTVEGGQAYFNVSPGNNLFKVRTPNADLTVYGTVFDVQVNAASTRVVLSEGEVGVQHNEFPLFKYLRPNHQIDIVSGVNSMAAKPVNTDSMMAWSEDLKSDNDAYTLFLARIDSRSSVEEISMGRDYVMTEPLNGRHLQGVRVSWVPQPQAWNFCGYDLLVFNNETNKVIFLGKISPEVFLDSRKREIELLNHTGMTPSDARYIRVALRPDCPAGSTTAPELEVKFILLQKGATR